MICGANQLTGFYMIATLAFDELKTWKQSTNADTEAYLQPSRTSTIELFLRK